MSETTNKHKAEAPKTLNFAVLTFSTSRSKEFLETGHLDDPSGDLIFKKLRENGQRVTMRKLVNDDKNEIQRVILKALKSYKIDAIVTCGGTGITARDVTIESVQPLLEKEIPGFGEIFRTLSYQSIGSAALLSRAIAGVARRKVILCLPGSLQSISLALEHLIIPEVAHIVKHARES